MEYRITTSEIAPQCQNTEEYTGLLVHIRPPVQVDRDAVKSYLMYKDFEPIDPSDPTDGLEVKDVTVLGSTSEQTTMYASILTYHGKEEDFDEPPVRRITRRVTKDVAKILEFMGAQALVE